MGQAKLTRDPESLSRKEKARYHSVLSEGKIGKKFFEELIGDCVSQRVVNTAIRLKANHGVGVAIRYLAFTKAMSPSDFAAKVSHTTVQNTFTSLSKFEEKEDALQKARKRWNLETKRDRALNYKCPDCHSSNLEPQGYRNYRPKFKCKDCGRTFHTVYERNAFKSGIKEDCQKLLAQGHTKQQTAKMMGVDQGTLRKWNLEHPAPFIRWAGGKTKLVKALLSRVPQEFNQYFEPFVGAGTLFFKVWEGRQCYISDANQMLMIAYQAIRDQPEELIAHLKGHIYEKEYYYKLREVDRNGEIESWSEIEKASRFLYLIKTCFNGIYRVNRDNQYNVPFGRIKSPKICQEDLLLACSKALQNTTIGCGDYQEIEAMVKPGDFVYFDPPYISVTSSKAHRYTPHPFEGEQTKELKQLCDRLSSRGVYWMLSNSHCDFTVDLFGGYNLEIIKTNRSISCKGEGRKPINEILVTNY